MNITNSKWEKYFNNNYNKILHVIITELKMTRRAESPVINSVGQRPTKQHACSDRKPQRGVINLIINYQN